MDPNENKLGLELIDNHTKNRRHGEEGTSKGGFTTTALNKAVIEPPKNCTNPVLIILFIVFFFNPSVNHF